MRIGAPAIVIERDAGDWQIGFDNGSTGTLPRGARDDADPRSGRRRHMTRSRPATSSPWRPKAAPVSLRSIPKISGGLRGRGTRAPAACWRCRAGSTSRIQSFNRATQAHAPAGLDDQADRLCRRAGQGLTPASIIVDGPFCVYQGAKLGQKCFRNFGDQRGAGPQTMRWGVEQSRNLMTVRVANQIGMDHVVDLIQRIGVEQKFPPYLSFALGAGETTVSRMVNAYSILVNHGRALNPTLIDFVQDRRGKVIWPENWRACDRCNAPDWDGKPMPRPVTRAKQVVEPMSAYQMVHIAEGVIQRGTATVLRDLGRPIFGKTGTTSGPTDVWFVGGTPQMIGGVYLGYDSPTNLGGYAQGGTIAAPIFKQFAITAFKGMDKLPFRAPAGIRMVRIDRASGRKRVRRWPTSDPKAGVIWEAFKPESEPQRRRRPPTRRRPRRRPSRRRPRPRPRHAADSDFLQRQGGIY